MATLERLRKRSGILLAIIVGIALIAFVLDDFIKSSGSIFGSSRRTDIGKIDGEKVTIQLYESKVQEMTDFYKQNYGETNLSEEIMHNIREQVWQELVNEKVLSKEFQQIGLVVSPEELFDMMQGANPHQLVRQVFTNRETGIFDKGQLVNFIKNIDEYATPEQKQFWFYLEDQIEKERLQTKYNALINKSIYITKYQAERRFIENNQKVAADIVRLGFETVTDSSKLTVTDGELKKYYKEHKNEYKQKASRDIEFITFDIKASDADFNEISAWMDKTKEEFINTKELKQFVNLNSDSVYDEKNYKENELTDSIKSLFNAKLNETTIIGPYIENGAFKMARLSEINYLPDSVKARHILIQPSEALPFERAQLLADSIKNELEKGSDFAAMAMKFSADKGSAQKGGDVGWFKEGRMVKEFNDSCFFAKTTKLMIVKTNFGLHIIDVTEKSASVKKVQIAKIIRNIVPSEQTINDIYTKASKFAGINNTIEKFELAAQKEGLQIQQSGNILSNSRTIPGVNSAREIVRWAFNAKKGEISIQPFQSENLYIITALKEIKEEGFATFESIKENIKPALINEKKAAILTEKIKEVNSSNLQELAQKLNTQIINANDISFSSYTLQNIGIEPTITAAAASLKKDEISKPLKGTNGVFVIKVNSVSALPSGEGEYPGIKQGMKDELTSRSYYSIFEALKNNTKIIDDRLFFY